MFCKLIKVSTEFKRKTCLYIRAISRVN